MDGADQNEFIGAYDAFGDAIFRFIYFRVHDREQAKDILQETFVHTWEYTLRGKRIENIRAFLYRVARNLIIDDSRRKKAFSLDAMQDQGFDPPEDSRERIMRGIEERALLRFLDAIDEQYREVIVMRYVDDLGPKEIAQILGETENAVSVRIHRGIERLCQVVQEKHPST